MSDTVSTNFGRADLSQDVANGIEEMGNVDYVQAFRDFFPCRNLTPREYANNHLLKLRVKFVYIGSGEELPAKCPEGWDLLVVSGVAFTRRDCQEVTRMMEEAQTDDRILLGLPLAPINAVQQLRELLALRTLSKQERYRKGTSSGEGLWTRYIFVRKQLIDRARKALAPSGFCWMYKGCDVEKEPAGSRNAFISSFLQTVYHASPQVKLGCSTSQCVKILDELLDLNHPLQISNVGRQGGAKILRRFLVDTGIFVRTEDCGGYSRYEASEYMQNTDWTPIWRCCMDYLLGDGGHAKSVSLEDFSRLLIGIPWGISKPVQALLLAAMLRRFPENLSFEYDGEAVELSGQKLLDALASPKKWNVCYMPAAPDELDYLAEVSETFANDCGVPEGMFVSVWERAARAVIVWYQKLPGIAKLHPEKLSADARRFVALINDADKRENSHIFLSRFLPECCGCAGIADKEEQTAVIDWLRVCKEEIEQGAAEFKNALCAVLGGILGAEPAGEQPSAQWLDQQYRFWLQRLHFGRDLSGLSSYANLLRMSFDVEMSAEERWFVLIPRKMELPALDAWSRDMTLLYKTRLTKCCVELQTWNVRRLLPWPDGEDERKAKVFACLAGAFDGLQLSGEQREAVLLDMFERIV